MLTHDQRLITCRAMESFGGSFVKALGKALLHADQQNMAKIEGAFPEYMASYGPGSAKYSVKEDEEA